MENDAAQNREILRTILSNVDKLKEIMSDPTYQETIMNTVQTVGRFPDLFRLLKLNAFQELRQASIGPNNEIYRDLQQGLYRIHQETQVLPPAIDREASQFRLTIAETLIFFTQLPDKSPR